MPGQPGPAGTRPRVRGAVLRFIDVRGPLCLRATPHHTTRHDTPHPAPRTWLLGVSLLTAVRTFALTLVYSQLRTRPVEDYHKRFASPPLISGPRTLRHFINGFEREVEHARSDVRRNCCLRNSCRQKYIVLCGAPPWTLLVDQSAPVTCSNSSKRSDSPSSRVKYSVITNPFE